MATFVCPHWRPGEECRPYFKVHWTLRALCTLVGTSIAMATPVVNIGTALSGGASVQPLAIIVWAWGIVLFLTAVTSVVLVMHQMPSLLGCFLASLGAPTIVITFLTVVLPHL